jgi:hypothetical protein
MHLVIRYRKEDEELEQILDYFGEVLANDDVALSRILAHHQDDVAGDWSTMTSTELREQVARLGISDVTWIAD